VLAASRQNRELPFLPTLVCLWGAGWVTSAFTSLLFVGRLYPVGGSPALTVAANILLSAAVGAVVVRVLLRDVVGRELSYSAMLLALVAGSVVGTVAQLAAFAMLRGRSPAALGLSFLPGVLGALVSYSLLSNAAHAEAPAPAPALAPLEMAASAPPTSLCAELMTAVRESTVGLVAAVDAAEPTSVPSVIADGMIGLEVARKRLEETPLPGDIPAELPRRLALGMELLSNDLAETADEAALTTTGGARYRWELQHSEGLNEVREALAELRAFGY
jgi:xanthosine utilization system XapX-like protein